MKAKTWLPTLLCKNQGRADLQEIARFGDLVMLLTLLAGAAGALGASALLLTAGFAACFAGRGRTLGWIAPTACNVCVVALHIQLGRGTVKFRPPCAAWTAATRCAWIFPA